MQYISAWSWTRGMQIKWNIPIIAADIHLMVKLTFKSLLFDIADVENDRIRGQYVYKLAEQKAYITPYSARCLVYISAPSPIRGGGGARRFVYVYVPSCILYSYKYPLFSNF